MKLWVVSDLHLDCGGEWPRPPAEADVAVVAGDVCDDRWIEETSRHLPVIFVCGNHELYRHAYHERLADLRTLCGTTLLDNSELAASASSVARSGPTMPAATLSP